MPSDPPRILAIRRRYLGDIALLSSFFRNLRLHWPVARITAMVEAAYAPVLSMIPDVNTTLVLSPGVGALLGILRTLRRGGFTHVFDLDNNDRTALLTRVTGAPFRATLHLETVPRHFPSFYTHTAFVRFDDYHSRSITETYLSLLATAKVPIATRESRLFPRPEDLAATLPFASNASPKVLVHPGSRSAFRIWPAENFAAVCDRLQTELKAHVSMVGGPADGPQIEAICQAAKHPPTVVPTALSVPQFAALASQFDVLLCHDSGPMHIAAAVGTPVVALFGSQNTSVWGPVGKQHAVLQPPMPCQNCVAPKVCVPGDSYRNYCVRHISVEQVIATVREKLR